MSKQTKKDKKDHMSIRKLLVIVFVIMAMISALYLLLTKQELHTYDYISIGLIVIFVIAIIVLFALIPDSSFFNKQKTYEEEKIDILFEAKEKRDVWQKSAVIWQTVNYLLQGLSAIFLGVVIYVNNSSNDIESITLYSILSFGVMFAILILNPNKVSIAYSQSYVDIYTAILNYSTGKATKEDIVLIASKCEQRISDATH